MLCMPKLITRSLPYGHFITWILKYFSVPNCEPSCRPSESIGVKAVSSLGFEWQNGTWVKFTDNKFTFLAPSDDRPLNVVVSADQLLVFSLSFWGQRRRCDPQCLPLLLQPLHLLCHLPSLLFLKRLLFSSLWMRCEHSSSVSFMDSASSLSTLAFHICIHLHHHHPHHLSSLLCFYLDTPKFHLLHYVLLFSITWMVVMILDYVFVLDNMDFFWLFVIS